MVSLFDSVAVVQQQLEASNISHYDVNRIYNLLEDQLDNEDRVNTVVAQIIRDVGVNDNFPFLYLSSPEQIDLDIYDETRNNITEQPRLPSVGDLLQLDAVTVASTSAHSPDNLEEQYCGDNDPNNNDPNNNIYDEPIPQVAEVTSPVDHHGDCSVATILREAASIMDIVSHFTFDDIYLMLMEKKNISNRRQIVAQYFLNKELKSTKSDPENRCPPFLASSRKRFRADNDDGQALKANVLDYPLAENGGEPASKKERVVVDLTSGAQKKVNKSAATSTVVRESDLAKTTENGIRGYHRSVENGLPVLDNHTKLQFLGSVKKSVQLPNDLPSAEHIPRNTLLLRMQSSDSDSTLDLHAPSSSSTRSYDLEPSPPSLLDSENVIAEGEESKQDSMLMDVSITDRPSDNEHGAKVDKRSWRKQDESSDESSNVLLVAPLVRKRPFRKVHSTGNSLEQVKIKPNALGNISLVIADNSQPSLSKDLSVDAQPSSSKIPNIRVNHQTWRSLPKESWSGSDHSSDSDDASCDTLHCTSVRLRKKQPKRQWKHELATKQFQNDGKPLLDKVPATTLINYQLKSNKNKGGDEVKVGLASNALKSEQPAPTIQKKMEWEVITVEQSPSIQKKMKKEVITVHDDTIVLDDTLQLDDTLLLDDIEPENVVTANTVPKDTDGVMHKDKIIDDTKVLRDSVIAVLPTSSPSRQMMNDIANIQKDIDNIAHRNTAQPSTSKEKPQYLPSTSKEDTVPMHKHVEILKKKFPDIDIGFLETFCQQFDDSVPLATLVSHLQDSSISVDAVIADVVANVPKEADPSFVEAFQAVQAILPDADPNYLHEMLTTMAGNEDAIKTFVSNAFERRNYPTRQQSIEKQNELKLVKSLTDNFNIQEFLSDIPDPSTFFSLEGGKTVNDRDTDRGFLFNRYLNLSGAVIEKAYVKNKDRLYPTCKALDKSRSRGKHPSREYQKYKTINAIPFLQEVAFINNEAAIRGFIADRDALKKIAFDYAKAKGELLTCQCCYDEEVLLENMAACDDGHLFCKECIRRGVEAHIGEGKTKFPCFMECTENFSFETLKPILKPSVFTNIVNRSQLEEVKAAGIEDLETCPFCDFSMVPLPDDKVFTCLNPICLKTSCRLCKEISHIPLRCDEVEKSDEVKARTFIEDRMTTALIRTCWKCSKKFIKEDGCNKMTCTCGAQMCYLCRQPVKDYSHFNGQGGLETHKCPLFTNNDLVHVNDVQAEAKKAKEEMAALNPTVTLKHDPTKILPQPKHPVNPAANVRARIVGEGNGIFRNLGLAREDQIRFRQDMQRMHVALHRQAVLNPPQINVGRRQGHERVHHRFHELQRRLNAAWAGVEDRIAQDQQLEPAAPARAGIQIDAEFQPANNRAQDEDAEAQPANDQAQNVDAEAHHRIVRARNLCAWLPGRNLAVRRAVRTPLCEQAWRRAVRARHVCRAEAQPGCDQDLHRAQNVVQALDVDAEAQPVCEQALRRAVRARCVVRAQNVDAEAQPVCEQDLHRAQNVVRDENVDAEARPANDQAQNVDAEAHHRTVRALNLDAWVPGRDLTVRRAVRAQAQPGCIQDLHRAQNVVQAQNVDAEAQPVCDQDLKRAQNVVRDQNVDAEALPANDRTTRWPAPFQPEVAMPPFEAIQQIPFGNVFEEVQPPPMNAWQRARTLFERENLMRVERERAWRTAPQLHRIERADAEQEIVRMQQARAHHVDQILATEQAMVRYKQGKAEKERARIEVARQALVHRLERAQEQVIVCNAQVRAQAENIIAQAEQVIVRFEQARPQDEQARACAGQERCRNNDITQRLVTHIHRAEAEQARAINEQVRNRGEPRHRAVAQAHQLRFPSEQVAEYDRAQVKHSVAKRDELWKRNVQNVVEDPRQGVAADEPRQRDPEAPCRRIRFRGHMYRLEAENAEIPPICQGERKNAPINEQQVNIPLVGEPVNRLPPVNVPADDVIDLTVREQVSHKHLRVRLTARNEISVDLARKSKQPSLLTTRNEQVVDLSPRNGHVIDLTRNEQLVDLPQRNEQVVEHQVDDDNNECQDDGDDLEYDENENKSQGGDGDLPDYEEDENKSQGGDGDLPDYDDDENVSQEYDKDVAVDDADGIEAQAQDDDDENVPGVDYEHGDDNVVNVPQVADYVMDPRDDDDEYIQQYHAHGMNLAENYLAQQPYYLP